jgi:hypothetical protein
MRRMLQLLRSRYFNPSLQELVRGLPARALVPLALAIFALFSILGWMVDVLGGARTHPFVLGLTAVLSGTLGMAYAFGSMRRNVWLFASAIALNLLFAYAGKTILTAFPQIPLAAVPERLRLDALATLLSVTSSYACFLWFINGTAARYLRVRAEIDLAHDIHQVLVPTVSRTIGRFEFSGCRFRAARSAAISSTSCR